MKYLDYVKVYVRGSSKGSKIRARMFAPTDKHIQWVRQSSETNLRPDAMDVSNKWYAINIEEVGK